MLSLALVSVLDQLRAGNCRIVSFGDWDQLPPVGNSWRGTSVDPQIFKDSALLKTWSDHNLFVLTRCRRSDEAHFGFYTSLHEDLSTAITRVRASYKTGTRADLHLVISHRKRRALNAKQQATFADGKALIKIPAHDGESEYDCVRGTPLVGTCTGQHFVNGAFYEVVGIDGLRILDKLTGEALECSIETLAKHTALAWALVYNRAQGCTIREQTLCLHDLHSRYFRRAHLYVGLSRVTHGADIRIAP